MSPLNYHIEATTAREADAYVQRLIKDGWEVLVKPHYISGFYRAVMTKDVPNAIVPYTCARCNLSKIPVIHIAEGVKACKACLLYLLNEFRIFDNGIPLPIPEEYTAMADAIEAAITWLQDEPPETPIPSFRELHWCINPHQDILWIAQIVHLPPDPGYPAALAEAANHHYGKQARILIIPYTE